MPDYGGAVFARILATTVALAMVVVLAGCVGEPAPAPTPTPTAPFASEEEAFAAAEETYRAYVDALNQVDLSDPETFEAVYAWTTGELNASDREGLTTYHAEGISKSGTSVARLVDPNTADGASVRAAVCLDVSNIDLVDMSGDSVVSPDRVDVQSLTVVAVESDSSPTGFLIETVGPREGSPECV